MKTYIMQPTTLYNFIYIKKKLSQNSLPNVRIDCNLFERKDILKSVGFSYLFIYKNRNFLEELIKGTARAEISCFMIMVRNHRQK